jgi:hypothetical protein
MKSITKASRINAAVQVIQYMNSGMTVVTAYKTVGLSHISSYNIILQIFSHAKNTDIFPIYSLYGSETPE